MDIAGRFTIFTILCNIFIFSAKIFPSSHSLICFKDVKKSLVYFVFQKQRRIFYLFPLSLNVPQNYQIFLFFKRRAPITQFKSGLVGAIALLTHLERQSLKCPKESYRNFLTLCKHSKTERLSDWGFRTLPFFLSYQIFTSGRTRLKR